MTVRDFGLLQEELTLRDGGTVVRARTRKEDAYVASVTFKKRTWSDVLREEAELGA